MSFPVEEVLALWRALERARDAFPAGSPERRLVDDEIPAIRELYGRLTAAAATAHESDEDWDASIRELGLARGEQPDDEERIPLLR